MFIATALVLLAIATAFLLVQRTFKDWDFLTKVGSSIVMGIIFLGTILFVLYGFFYEIYSFPVLILLIFLTIFISLLWLNRNFLKNVFINLTIFELFFSLALLIFSFWLMFHSFSYNSVNYTFGIGSHLWSDFGSHIPLMRSFSLGYNFPPQFPLFAGENIRYHFMFYFLAGALEKLDGNLAYGLNLISSLGFWAMLLMIYSFAKKIFDGAKLVGVLAVIITLFNSSLTFVNYFQQHNIFLISTIKEILNNHSFIANGPYDSYDKITTFWSLNIYLNQRHLALAFAAALFVIYIYYEAFCLQKKCELGQFILVMAVFALLPLWHAQVFVMVLVISFLINLLFMRKANRNSLLYFASYIAILPLGFVQIAWLNNLNPFLFISGLIGFNLDSLKTSRLTLIKYEPGYLIPKPVILFSFVDWWFENLGLLSLLIIDAFLLLARKLKLLFICFLSIFFLGYLFRFAPDIATNHKFFNFFVILANMFVASFLVRLWRRHLPAKLLAGVLLFFLILSGVMEFFPVVNDSEIEVKDWKANVLGEWVEKNTSKEAIFLTSNNIYHPVSLAGRKVFMGWPYFAWSAGSDTDARGRIVQEIYDSGNKQNTRALLKGNNISFVVLEDQPDQKLSWQNKIFFDNNFEKVFDNFEGDLHYLVYEVTSPCN
ncbi:MAG: hypothetical protein Q8P91_02250 [bacterium]|nr:hypothetical protein [bacterium]